MAKKCCFCGKELEHSGNNPAPIITGQGKRCCDACNQLYVVPIRIYYSTGEDTPEGKYC